MGNAFIWDLTTGAEISRLALKKREYVIVSASFSHNDQQLVTGAPGKDISLWDVKTGERLKRWQARTRKQGKPSGAIIYAVAFTQDNQFIFSESSAGYGEKWSIN